MTSARKGVSEWWRYC